MSTKNLCLERDAYRCRHCGSDTNIDVFKIENKHAKSKTNNHISNLISLCKKCHNEVEYINKNHNTNIAGVILCGGRGTRLSPLTMFQNKHTLPVGLVPMIMYPLKTLIKFCVRNIVVVVDRSDCADIISILGSGKEFGVNISYKIQEGAGGISEALLLAEDVLGEKFNKVVVILGDNIFDNSDVDFSIDENNHNASVYCKIVKNPWDYGVVSEKDSVPVEIVEKPKVYIGNKAVTGLYIYPSDIFDVIRTIKPGSRGELEISDVNNYYLKEKRIEIRTVNSYWLDCGGSIHKYTEAMVAGAKNAMVDELDCKQFISNVFCDR